MADEYKNATSLYDNAVKPSEGKGKTSSSVKQSISDSISSVKGQTVQKMNKLKSASKTTSDAAKGATKGAKESAKNALKNFASSATKMVKTMAKDAVTGLKNASKNFIQNTLNQLLADIKSNIYIPDQVFVVTIKALYYAGADLAYMDHYLRNKAITSDWNYTLKFLDEAYGIKYSTEYDKIEQDLNLAATSGAFKNIEYMFGEMLKYRNGTTNEIKSLDSSINSVSSKIPGSSGVLSKASSIASTAKNAKSSLTSATSKFPASITSKLPGKISSNDTLKSDLTKSKSKVSENAAKYDRWMVKYTKVLITYGYSSLTPNEVKKIIKMTNGIVLPRYFGTTDNKYSKTYNFTQADCKIMMPKYVPDPEVDAQEKANLQGLVNTNTRMKALGIAQDRATASREAAKAEGYEKLAEDPNNEDWYRSDMRQNAAESKVKSKLSTFKANYNEKNLARTHQLSTTAINKGSKQVFQDTRARYHQNKDGVKVKYRKSMTSYVEGALEGGDSEETVTLRNANIRAIYTLLSSQSIYGNDCMVNDTFYKRCKLKTGKQLDNTLDRAKGLLGASSVVQTLYDIQDFIDSSAYKYTVKMESHCYNPQRKVMSMSNMMPSFDLSMGQDGKLILPIINDAGTVTETSNIEEAIKHPETFKPTTAGSTVNNDNTKDEIEDKLNSDLNTKKEVLNTIRYTKKLPMLTKKDILIKYISWFYNAMIKDNISETIANNCFNKLIYNIFGRTDIKSISQLDKLFENCTNESLTNNINMYISISYLKLLSKYLELSAYGEENESEINYIYDITVKLMEIEVKSGSFARAVFSYDNEYIKTLVKQKFKADLNQLKSLQPDNMSNFWSQKDSMTKSYDGFDRFGIFGFDERTIFRVKYTNVEVGDWNSICVSSEGIFFGGSDNTSNNGIKYLDKSSDTIMPTSITSGTWKIFEKNKNTYFLNTEGSLRVWNSNRNDVDNLMANGDKYDYIEFPQYDLAFAIGKANNGIRIIGKTFKNVISTGSNFKYFIDKNKIFFYSETSATSIPTVDLNTKAIEFASTTAFVATTPITFSVEFTVTEQKQQSSSSESNTSQSGSTSEEPEEITTTNYYHHIVFGRQDGNGIIDLCNISEDSSKYNTSVNPWTSEDVSVSSGSYHLYKTDKQTINAIRDNSATTESKGSTLKICELEQSATVQEGQTAEIEPTFEISNFDKFILANNFSYVNGFLLFSAKIPSGSSYITKFYVHNPEDSNIFELKPIKSDINIKFYPTSDKTKYSIYGVDQENRVYGYDYKNHNLNIILDDDRYRDNIDGWEYGYVDDTYGYFYNNKVDIGLIGYNSVVNSPVFSNITTGYWKMIAGRNYYYALSQNGTNSGVMISTKDRFLFSNITDQKIDHYDIAGFAYDSSQYKTYLGTERSKDTLNVDSINYDIDEFVYLQNAYQLYKLVETVDGNKTNDQLNDIYNKLGKKKASELLKEVEKANKNYKNSLDQIETDSPYYTDLITNIMANEEFDVDNKNSIYDIETDLIIGDEGKNSKTYMLLNDKMNTKFYVNTIDNKYKDLKSGTREFNIVNDYATFDFLNSDESDFNSIPISK